MFTMSVKNQTIEPKCAPKIEPKCVHFEYKITYVPVLRISDLVLSK